MRVSRGPTRGRLAAACVAVASLTLGPAVQGQNTIGGDKFKPGEADFIQSGHEVGRGPGFQFSDRFYAKNGLDASVIRGHGAFRFAGDGIGTVFDHAPDGRFANARILPTNMGYNAVGENLYYPDPPAAFFADAFTNDARGQKAREIANEFRAFIFPRTQAPARTIPGCEGVTPSLSPFDPSPCNRRQDNLFDTGLGYLTDNPLGLWRLTFVLYTDAAGAHGQCSALRSTIADRNGLDEEGRPLLKRKAEITELADEGCVTLGQRAEDGANGAPWVV